MRIPAVAILASRFIFDFEKLSKILIHVFVNRKSCGETANHKSQEAEQKSKSQHNHSEWDSSQQLAASPPCPQLGRGCAAESRDAPTMRTGMLQSRLRKVPLPRQRNLLLAIGTVPHIYLDLEIGLVRPYHLLVIRSGHAWTSAASK